MYGLINKAVQELVIQTHGEETWRKIRLRAGLEEEEIIGLKSYPDQLTYNLLEAGSAELGIQKDKLMEMCGEKWISHTATNGYENVLNLAGSNMIDFLHHLNTIHAKITYLMPDMKPPVFRVKNEFITSVELLYKSERDGFQPMVIGILRGLGRRFGLDVSVHNFGPDKDFPEFTHFKISW